MQQLVPAMGEKVRWGEIARAIYQKSGFRFFKKPKQYR